MTEQRTGADFVPVVRRLRSAMLAIALLLLVAAPVSAQDLDPRAYAHIPVNGTFLVWGLSVSHGGVVSDPTLPVTDLNATVETPSIGVARSFDMFGKTAQVFGALPYSWAQASGKVFGEGRDITRAGLSDARFRLSALLRGPRPPRSASSPRLRAGPSWGPA